MRRLLSLTGVDLDILPSMQHVKSWNMGSREASGKGSRCSRSGIIGDRAESDLSRIRVDPRHISFGGFSIFCKLD